MERIMAPDLSQPSYFVCLLMTRSLLLRVRFDCLLVLLLLHLSGNFSSWLAGGRGKREKKNVRLRGGKGFKKKINPRGRGERGEEKSYYLLMIDKNPDDLGPRQVCNLKVYNVCAHY